MAKREPLCSHPGYRRIRMANPEKHFGRWYWMEKCRDCDRVLRGRQLSKKELEKRGLS